jgi:hypothetical protein
VATVVKSAPTFGLAKSNTFDEIQANEDDRSDMFTVATKSDTCLVLYSIWLDTRDLVDILLHAATFSPALFIHALVELHAPVGNPSFHPFGFDTKRCIQSNRYPIAGRSSFELAPVLLFLNMLVCLSRLE